MAQANITVTMKPIASLLLKTERIVSSASIKDPNIYCLPTRIPLLPLLLKLSSNMYININKRLQRKTYNVILIFSVRHPTELFYNDAQRGILRVVWR